MKLAAKIIGAVLMLVGAFLVLQSLNVLHGAGMAGHVKWAGWGAWGLAFGAGFLVWASRERPKT